MRTIIAGSRDVTKDIVLNAIEACPFKTEITTVLSGAARGPDTFGALWALSQGLELLEYPAAWDKYGKSAGYKRNAEMADNAEALIAVWDGRSNGTKNMIHLAKQQDLKLFVYNLLEN